MAWAYVPLSPLNGVWRPTDIPVEKPAITPHSKPLCTLPFYSLNICLLSFDFYETGVGKFSRAVEISFPL